MHGFKSVSQRGKNTRGVPLLITCTRIPFVAREMPFLLLTVIDLCFLTKTTGKEKGGKQVLLMQSYPSRSRVPINRLKLTFFIFYTAFIHPKFLKGRTDLLNSIQKSEKKRSSPKNATKSSGTKRSEFDDSDSDDATNTAILLSRSSKLSGSAKKARRTRNATVKQKSNPHGASESASSMALPPSGFIDGRADDLQGSPQNALRVLLASQDVSAVSMGLPLGETPDFRDNQTGNISGSFLSSGTDQSQAAMIGQGLHQTAAHYPGPQQVGWNQEHDSLPDAIMSMRLLQQQQQQELLQLQLQSQQQQSQRVTGDLAYQSPQMMQHFLERQVANGYNSFQTGAIGGGRFDMNIGPNFPGQPMIMDVNSRSQAGIWDNVLEPRPLAPHALQPPVGVPNVLGRSSNVGESKTNEFEDEDGLITYILSNPGAPNFETNQGETKSD